MTSSLFYSNIEKGPINTWLIEAFEDYCSSSSTEQVYLLTSPLAGCYSYSYEENALVVLSPRHRITFIDLGGNDSAFNEYCEDFIEDLNSIADKYGYQKHIGRPRAWKSLFIYRTSMGNIQDVGTLLQETRLDTGHWRKCELLISLVIGSINDVESKGAEAPETLLERVKKNIILFDGDQTRFIYQPFEGKTVSIQGLSGTGKTELLLHKLKELYTSSSESRICLTCHNKALANALKRRVPDFFNFMRVDKQIEWGDRLLVSRAWGNERDPQSGLYAHICNAYNIPFMRFGSGVGYREIFTKALESIREKKQDGSFRYVFDYILIDERQDFPDVFFEFCEEITRTKLFIAGDIFQDIFETSTDVDISVDIMLNRCYRTDPRTLMFAHAIGMGLFEPQKFNWLSDEHWRSIGYSLKREASTVFLSREPIRRFEDLHIEEVESMIMYNLPHPADIQDKVIDIIRAIRSANPTAQSSDIAIIFLDDTPNVYKYADQISIRLLKEFGCQVNRAYETKEVIEGMFFLSNKNNVKGLEFPFVICITDEMQDNIRYRNGVYTMLTRSFIQSYLLVSGDAHMHEHSEGLRIINSHNYIRATEPTPLEIDSINQRIVQMREDPHVSYREFLWSIFNEQRVDTRYRDSFQRAIESSQIPPFDYEATTEFVKQNKKYFCS